MFYNATPNLAVLKNNGYGLTVTFISAERINFTWPT